MVLLVLHSACTGRDGVPRSGEDQIIMVMHMDQDHIHLNGQNGHNGHKNIETLHDPVLSEFMADQQVLPQEPKVDYARLLELGRELLIAIGENPDREGLLDTPRRWADWWRRVYRIRSRHNRYYIPIHEYRPDGLCLWYACLLSL